MTFEHRDSRLGLSVLVAAAAYVVASGPAGAWSLEEASAPYKGQTVHIACEAYAPCIAFQKFIPEFEQRTGIKVTVEAGDLGQLQQQTLTDALTGTQVYDLVQMTNLVIGAWGEHGFAAPMQPFLDDAALHDPGYKLEDMAPGVIASTGTYKGQLFGVPYMLNSPFGIYRKDIAADPAEQAAFKAKYGYDTPFNGDKFIEVDTWQKWWDVAEFYNRKKGEKAGGMVLENDLWGTAAAFKRHVTIFYDYERILLGMSGVMVDDNNVPQFDKPEAKKALDYFLGWRKFSPPSYREYTWDEEYSDFCTGKLFSTPGWADSTAMEEKPEECPAVAGKIGYFLHPGPHTVSDGASWVIPAKSKNKEGAFLLAQFLGSYDVQSRCHPLGCLSFRKDVLGMSELDNDGATVMFRKLLSDPNLVYPRPALPEWVELQPILLDELSAAGADQQDADTTLKNLQARFSEILAQ
ncbi:MAG: ABC transporter substrate-binding protein [Parvibaculaceae bacterium]